MKKPWKNAKAKTTFGRKSAISIVASYNQTDWTSGWNHFIQGCTIFINPEFELTLVSGSSIQNDLKDQFPRPDIVLNLAVRPGR